MKKHNALLIVVLSLIELAAAIPLQASETFEHCGTWRWSIKTLTDQKGLSVLHSNARVSSIDSLVALERPRDANSGNNERYEAEGHLVRCRALLIAHKQESSSDGDHDYHLVLKSTTADETLIAEIPSANCPEVANQAELKELFTELRNTYDAEIGRPTQSLKNIGPIEVELVGVPFFDKEAHGTGHSKNGIEIHPVVSITRLGTTAQSFVSAENDKSSTKSNEDISTQHTEIAMAPERVLSIVLLGALLGMIGQGVRFIIGHKKLNDAIASEGSRSTKTFDTTTMLVSFVIAFAVGAVAGVLASFPYITEGKPFDSHFIPIVVAAGYAGTDFIEGFVQRSPIKGKVKGASSSGNEDKP